MALAAGLEPASFSVNSRARSPGVLDQNIENVAQGGVPARAVTVSSSLLLTSGAYFRDAENRGYPEVYNLFSLCLNGKYKENILYLSSAIHQSYDWFRLICRPRKLQLYQHNQPFYNF
jgi:hypothetical protein